MKLKRNKFTAIFLSAIMVMGMVFCTGCAKEEKSDGSEAVLYR